VLKRRQQRKNYHNGRKAGGRLKFLSRLMFCFKIITGCALLVAVSGIFILLHDFLTQCDYFRTQSFTIEGNQRLSQKQITDQAQIKAGMNILAVNLSLARKRLLAHPWIAEVEIRREIPPGLNIKIKEHTPLAIVDLGRKFLINPKGEIFKEWSPSDPYHLPVVSGLKMSDITAYAKDDPAGLSRKTDYDGQPEDERKHYSPLDAVMQVLRLGMETGSVLPNEHIIRIRVDREIGLSLQAFSEVKTINLGYHNYSDKYAMLKSIIAFLNNKGGFPNLDRIDLNNLNRIVVNPIIGEVPANNDKEI